MIDKFLAAGGDREAWAAVLTKDAILEDYLSNVTTEGRDQILDYVSRDPVLFETSAEAIKVGDYIVQPTVALNEEGTPFGYGIHVFEITGDGLVKHVWVSGTGVD